MLKNITQRAGTLNNFVNISFPTKHIMASRPQNAQEGHDKMSHKQENFQTLSESPSHVWHDKTSNSAMLFYQKRQLDRAIEEIELVAKKKTLNSLTTAQLEIPTRPQYKQQEQKGIESEKDTLHPEDCQNHSTRTACEKAKMNEYLEKRRKNNASAKKSREARRQRELENQIRVSYLEDENSKLRSILCVLRNENIQLRELLIM